MRQALERLGGALDTLEQWAKRAGTAAALALAVGVLVPPVGKALNVVSAWRFGAHGVVKYELGDAQSGEEKGRRALTRNGQFRVLRSGPVEIGDLQTGDVLQAISDVNFHEAGPCVAAANCASARVVFNLRQGDCVVVLSHAYADDGADDASFTNKRGGWLRVATAACGLFR